MYNEFGDNMRRTKVLVKILLLLIFAFVIYGFAENYKGVTTTIVKIVKKYSRKAIVIPTDTKHHRTYLYDTVSETDNFEPRSIDDIKKIYYTVLNNGWLSFTFYCDDEYVTCIDDVKKVANSQNDQFISTINAYVNPFNSYRKYNTTIVDGYKIELSVEKLYTDEEIEKLEKIIDSFLIRNRISSETVTKNDIKKIHDYIIKNTTYDDEYEQSNEITESNKATGALIHKKALCSGYSDAFALFMDKINIPNFEVTSEEHEWNAIYFNNKWYHVDTTWDDDETNKYNTSNFFLINTNELLLKDKKEHNFDKEIFLEFK